MNHPTRYPTSRRQWLRTALGAAVAAPVLARPGRVWAAPVRELALDLSR